VLGGAASGTAGGTLGATLGANAAAAASVDASATRGSFAIGLPVRDPTGLVIGRITRLTTDASGHSVAMVRQGADTLSIPVARLTMRGNYAVSAETRDELQGKGRR
jgi:hypothetical protein